MITKKNGKKVDSNGNPIRKKKGAAVNKGKND